MKHSIAALSAFLATALATPQFLNSNYLVQEGVPFTLQFTGCSGGSGCTISLQDGPQSNLHTVKVLSTDVSGGSLTVTLDDVPSGTYNFKITDSNGDSNYSQQFPYEGSPAELTTGGSTAIKTATGTKTGSASASATATGSSTGTKKELTTVTGTATGTKTGTSAVSSTTAAVTSTTAVSSSTKAAATTTTTGSSSVVSTTAANSTTHVASTTLKTTAGTTVAGTTRAVATTPPGSGAASLSSPMALVGGILMGLVYLW